MRQSFTATRRLSCLCAVGMIAGICTLQGATAQTAPASTAAGQSAYVNTVQELTLTAAQKLVAAGVEYAAGHDMRLSVSVVDRAGNLLAFARMDGASIVTVDVAMGKARTAAFLKAPSKVFEDMINAGKPSMATTPGLLPLQGGMPVMYNGTVLGAVGVSGSSGENDQAVAALIADAFAKF